MQRQSSFCSVEFYQEAEERTQLSSEVVIRDDKEGGNCLVTVPQQLKNTFKKPSSQQVQSNQTMPVTAWSSKES